MARGYSANRAKSARPTLRIKRERSLSMQRLKESIAVKEGDPHNNEEDDSTKKPPRAVGVDMTLLRGKRRPSAAGVARSISSKDPEGKKVTSTSTSVARKRSMSSLRTRVEKMEEELVDELEGSEAESEIVKVAEVMAKYKAAGRAVDEVLDILTAASVPGASTFTLCHLGDEELGSRIGGLFTKAKGPDGKRIPKGISYPTNISVNEVLCNHSPYREEEGVVLKANDVVKLHLGCHLDGYPVSAARTIVVVPSATEASIAAKSALLNPTASNAIEAARVALTSMIHMLRPGTLNADITNAIARIGNSFEVEAVEGVLSHRTKRWVPDGVDCIIGRRINTEDPHQDVADCLIDEHQVWSLDVAFTNNSTYRLTLTEEPTFLFRRTPEETHLDARVKLATTALAEITSTHFCFPFHFRHTENPLKTKMAIQVLSKNGLVDPLPVLRTKGSKNVTARFSATVAVTSKRISVLCGAPPAEPLAMVDELQPLPIPEDVLAIMKRPLVFAAENGHVTKGGMGKGSAAKKARLDVANEEA